MIMIMDEWKYKVKGEQMKNWSEMVIELRKKIEIIWFTTNVALRLAFDLIGFWSGSNNGAGNE